MVKTKANTKTKSKVKKKAKAIKAKKKVGRPCLLDNEKIRDGLIEFVRAGNWYTIACAACDISYSTFNSWMQEGQKLLDEYAEKEDKVPKGKLKYLKFMKAIKKAEAEVESCIVSEILSDKDWKAKMTYLERKYPDRWGRTDKHKINGEIKIDVAKLSDEELKDLIKDQ